MMISDKVRDICVKCRYITEEIKNFCYRRKRILFLGLLVLVYYLLTFKESRKIIRKASRHINRYFEAKTNTSYLRDDVGCLIPKMNPFHSDIISLFEEGPQDMDCEDGFPLLFKSTLTSVLVPKKTEEQMAKLGIESCCYKTIHRDGSDNDFRLSKACYSVSLVNITMVPEDHEFVAIHCEHRNLTNLNQTFTKIVDMHVFVHLNPTVEERIKNVTEKVETDERLNVVMFGIDAVSHMNFVRTMPETYSFLKNELSAMEMHGYHKVGHNTLPNAVGFLGSQTVNEDDVPPCEENHYFDNCSFIWKNYSQHGYRTSFGEDAAWMSIFNYLQKGFAKPPTDYYFRTFGKAAQSHIRHEKEGYGRRDLCYGPRLTFQVLLDYIKKVAYTMGRHKRYFQFIWATALTHDYLNNGMLGDRLMRSTLQWFYKGGYLNQTVFILMSDHGRRWGSIMDTQQGQWENRMPFLYFVIPSWFKEKYSLAYENMQANQNVLTTPFDLYETLKDLITLDDVNNKEIQFREMDLMRAEKWGWLPRGISHFLPIPLARNCKMAGIENYFCVCRNLSAISTENLAVRQAANYAVYYINSILSKYPECAFLSLSFVKNAKAGMTHSGDEDYQINFETSPGDASFEAVVLRDKSGNWTVSGTIDRTNSYESQSSCVDTRLGKLYCYCTDLSPEFKLNNTVFKI
ncbi:hypothetical protein Ocin01_00434 [Orchesella cincta]|uniref:DUF229 domain containing protein n=1 Tax=Orchesella cincta TaxID=48709 RepID=A0A1D2NM24_ORCCI|nr:hypothetical protein Ocin01_00434 [Orchesella cincta]